jgi:hypothetical protein
LRHLAFVDKLPPAFADDLPESFSVVLADINLGMAIVTVMPDRRILDAAAGRGDLNDFLEHVFLLFLCFAHTTPEVVVSAAEEKRVSSRA